MNFKIREVVKNKDIFKTCDFMAIKNNDDTYLIIANRRGTLNGRVSSSDFKKELMISDEPIILNTSLFKDCIKIK